MEPIKIKNVSPTECDVHYKFIPVPGGRATNIGEDKRRFVLEKQKSMIGMSFKWDRSKVKQPFKLFVIINDTL
jgi:hypothetical protein